MKEIFVVEDDGLMRRVLARFLEKEGYRATPFSSPEKALPALTTHTPDLLLSDINMPGMSGLELVEEIRSRGIALPVILISGNASEEIEARARCLGVKHLLRKPLRDLCLLAEAVSEELSSGAGDTESERREQAGFGELHLGFLTKLSHELRTPLTAIKLAIEGLCSDGVSAGRGGRDKLLTISRRNVDRIITLVESELGFLQMALGDLFVSRRLMGVKKLFERVYASQGYGTPENDTLDWLSSQEELYIFSDPDILGAVLGHILNGGEAGGRRNAVVSFHEAEGKCEITVLAGEGPVQSSPITQGYPAEPSCRDSQPTGEVLGEDACCLGSAAYRTIIEALGGEVPQKEWDPEGSFRFVLPVLPPYDRSKDLVNPVKILRKACCLSGKSIAFLRCQINLHDRSLNDPFSSVGALIDRCKAVISEGDAMVRGKSPGVFSLALLGRTGEELDRIISLLGKGGNGRVDLGVKLVQKVDPEEEAGTEEVLRDIEAVL